MNPSTSPSLYAQALDRFQHGEPFLDLLREIAAGELAQFEKAGCWGAQVLAVSDNTGCDACLADHERMYSLAEARRTMPIPHVTCSCWGQDNSLCRCTYIGVLTPPPGP